MAGTASRVFGVIFMILGVIILAGGVAGYAFGTDRQADNEEQFFEDQDETDENQALMTAGIVGMIVGFGFTILGVVLLVLGQSQSNQTRPQGAASDAITPAPKSNAPVAIGVTVFLAALAIILLLTIGGGTIGLNNPFAEDTYTESTTNGTIRNTVVAPMIGTFSTGEANVVFENTPEDVVGVTWRLDWTTQSGTETLSFMIEELRDDEWSVIASQEVTPGTEISSIEAFDNVPLRYTVNPIGDAYAVQEQAFQVSATFRIPA